MRTTPGRRQPRFWALLIAVLALVLGACADGGDDGGEEAAGGQETGAPAGEDEAVSVVMITHGSADDPFWSVAKNGADAAAEDHNVDFQYQAPTEFDMVEMGRLIEAAVARNPDGIAVTITDPDALRDPITSAVEAGIPVVSLNTGSDAFEELGIQAHVGQEERFAGLRAGELMAEEGVTNALCINQEQGNVALDLRCEGFAEGIEGAGGSSQVLAVEGGDPTGAQQRIQAALSQNPDINGMLALGPQGALPMLQALQQAGADQMTVGTFDLGPEVLQAVADGEMLFAIDQQQYMQGYLPVQFLAQNARYGLMPVGEVRTGPNFVTQEDAEQVIQLTEEGIR